MSGCQRFAELAPRQLDLALAERRLELQEEHRLLDVEDLRHSGYGSEPWPTFAGPFRRRAGRAAVPPAPRAARPRGGADRARGQRAVAGLDAPPPGDRRHRARLRTRRVRRRALPRRPRGRRGAQGHAGGGDAHQLAARLAADGKGHPTRVDVRAAAFETDAFCSSASALGRRLDAPGRLGGHQRAARRRRVARAREESGWEGPRRKLFAVHDRDRRNFPRIRSTSTNCSSSAS